MTYSIWTDNTNKSLDEIINNAINYNEWHTVEKDCFDNSDLNFLIRKRFNENYNIEDTNITFNVLDYEMEKIRPREARNPIRTTRVQSITGFIIVFTDGNITKYIINKSYSDNTKTILRKINNYEKQLEIIENRINIDSDLFFWVVNKVIDFPGIQIGEAQNMMLELVTGFKGETDDKLAEISGSGDRVLNLLSTLTFLLENEKLSRIELLLQHSNQTYGLKLGINSYIDIIEECYMGDDMLLPEDIKLPLIVLKVFLTVIPDLLNIYDQDINEHNWNNDKKREFLNSIGEIIQVRIKQKLGISEDVSNGS